MNEKELFNEEQKYLEKITKLIKEKIDIYQKRFDNQEHFIIGFKEGMRGTQFTRQSLMSLYSTEVKTLQSIIDNPYFARIDFQDEKGNINYYYIGKKTITDNNGKILVYDWRSPIASMYYDSSVGPAEYINNGEKVKGKILDKRQIIIENGILQEVIKHDTITDDKILLKYLENNSDSRLKSIVATIQKEQNTIIRNDISKSYLVKGVAGSGKTTVALHRIAYLLYNYNKDLSEKDFLIIGPNAFFLDYISKVLPELDIKNVDQSTFTDLALDLINGKYKIEDQNIVLEKVLNNNINKEVINYKSSLEFLESISSYFKQYIEENINRPLTYHGVELYSLDKIKNHLITNNLNNYNKRIEVLIKTIIQNIKDNSSDISHEIWSTYRNEFKNLSKDDPRRQEILDLTDNIRKELDNGCSKVVKEYFNNIMLTPLELYISFLENYKFDNEEFNKEKINMINNLKKKKVSYEDLAPLMLISYLLKGLNKTNEYTHLVVDEGQDLTLAEYYVLNKIYPKSKIDIYGDMNQAIYSYSPEFNFEMVNDKVYNDKLLSQGLTKSYRNTHEISETANLILEHLNVPTPLYIARNGLPVNVENSSADKDLLLKQINDYLKKEYKTIAIICKDSKESNKVYKKLIDSGVDANLINEKNNNYVAGICVLPTYLSKGLEFDGVIIYDASSNKYNEEDIIDMKLLYVSLTRALHELTINYSNELTKPLKTLVRKK